MLDTQSFCTTSNSRKLYHHHQNRKFSKAFTLYLHTAPNDERYKQNTNNKPNKIQNAKTKQNKRNKQQTNKQRRKEKKKKERKKKKRKKKQKDVPTS